MFDIFEAFKEWSLTPDSGAFQLPVRTILETPSPFRSLPIFISDLQVRDPFLESSGTRSAPVIILTYMFRDKLLSANRFNSLISFLNIPVF